MKKTIPIIALATLLMLTGVCNAYTVTVVNCSDRKVTATIAAWYLVTSQDHLTIVAEPHSVQTGDMGGLLSSGWRVQIEGIGTFYNGPSFSQGTTSFALTINPGPSAEPMYQISCGSPYTVTPGACPGLGYIGK